MKSQHQVHPFREFVSQNINFRTGIVAATLLLAWVLGQSPNVRFIGISVLLPLVLIILRFPAWGIVGLIVSSLLIPIAIGTGTQTQLPLSFIGIPLLWILWFIGNVVYKRPATAIYSRVTLALLGLIATVTIAFLSGYLPWNAFARLAPLRAQLGGWGLFVFSAGALLLTGIQINSLRWLKILVGVFLACASFLVIGRLTPALASLSQLVVGTAAGSVFWIWLVVLTAGQLFFNYQMANRVKFVLALLLAGVIYVSFSTSAAREWASGWIPPLMGLVCLGVLKWPRSAIIVFCFAAVAGIIGYRVIGDFVLSGDNAYSLLTRSAATEVLLKIIESNPWLGLGPANYYYYTPLYPILGWYVSFNSHNQYLDLIAQVGIIGLAFFLWTFVELILLAWKLRLLVRADGFALGYVYACISGVISMLVAGALGDWVIPFVYNVGVGGFRASVLGWIFLGGLLSINHLFSKQLESTTVPDVKHISPNPTRINNPKPSFQ